MSDLVSTPRLTIAGIGSESGKTTVALGLVNALRRRGRTVQTFTSGSDLIDAAYLAHASRRPCRTLDSWVLGRGGVLSSFALGVRDADCAVIEGAGGLFDGHGLITGPREGRSRFPGSTAEVAELLETPVLLVLDVAGMGETAAAIALGIRQLDPTLNVVGVILNHADNPHRSDIVEDAIWELAKLPVLGALPHSGTPNIPASHRDLQSLTQAGRVDHDLDELGDAIARYCNLEIIQRLMAAAPHTMAPIRHVAAPATSRVRVGVAFDDAFCFHYPENLELLEEAGAEVVTISPLDDHALPRDLDAVYLGGGIIENKIPQLAENRPFIESLRRLHQHGTPIYAECGGALYAARSVEAHDGIRHSMAGLFDADLTVSGERGRGRYREVQLSQDTLIAPAGQRLRGHEFHVSHRRDLGDTQNHAYSVSDCDGEPLGCEGWIGPNLVASLVHLHFGQDPEIARRLIDTAETAARRRQLSGV